MNMDKQPTVTNNTCFIKLRQEQRDKIVQQTKDFIKLGGKVDTKPVNWSYTDEEGKATNTFNRTEI
jgi:TfoX/Sxy family transcriptional regulator of competence genes